MKKYILLIGIYLILSVKIAAQNAELMIQTGHQKKHTYISLSADETKLFTVDENSVGILWDLSLGKQLRIFNGVSAGEFGEDSRSIVLFNTNTTVKTVDLSGNVLKSNPNRLWPSDVSRGIGLYPQYGLAFDNYFGLVNINTGKRTEMKSKKIASFALANLKGQILLMGGDYGKKTQIDICDINSGDLVRSIPLEFEEEGNFEFLSISKDNKTIFAGSSRNTFGYIIDFNSGKIIKKVDEKFGYYDGATLSPDGKKVLFKLSHKKILMDVATDYKYWEIEDEKDKNCFFSASGNKIVTLAKDGFQILNSTNGNVMQKLPISHIGSFDKFYLTANSKNLLYRADKKMVVNWNLATGVMEKPIPIESASSTFIAPCTFSSDGKIFFLPQAKSMIRF
jgi:WD40 repeat protein